MEPICDNHTPLYNVPMKFLGRIEFSSPMFKGNLDRVYACVDGICGRYFDQSYGYFSKEDRPNRTAPRCELCETVMCLVKVGSGDQSIVTYGCLVCGRTEEAEFSRL